MKSSQKKGNADKLQYLKQFVAFYWPFEGKTVLSTVQAHKCSALTKEEDA